MKKSLCMVVVLAVCFVAKAFVVKVSDLPEAVMKFPVVINSKLDNRTLDSIQPDGNNIILSGNLEKAEWCSLKYSFDIDGGVRTNFIPVFLGVENDTVDLRLTENFENGGSVVTGGELNDRREAIWKNAENIRGDELVEYVKKQAIENISNPLGVLLVGMLSSNLPPNIWLGLYHEMPADMAKYPELVQLAERLRAKEATGEGQMFQDMPCITTDGKKVRLSDYVGKGKFVLLDFWASWCGPCMAEVPNVKKVYEKFHAKGFEVIGISLDEKKEAWTNAIAKHDLNWLHVSSLKGWKCPVAALYSVTGIPATFLLDPEGKIIARNLRGEELMKEVAKVL